MIKSIFFRALTLLGLTFVLIGCGAADPGDSGTGTGTSSTPAALSMDDVTKEVEKLIRDSKGKVDLTDGVAVATKIVSIMKASQPLGSCSLFNQGIFPVAAAAPFFNTYTTKGDAYPGGSGSLTVDKGSVAATGAGVLAANTIITYTYDKYSIDGIYFLDGALKMKQAAATVATTPGVSDFTAEESTLTLSEGGVAGAEGGKIATAKFAATFKPAFTAVAGGICGSTISVMTAQANAVTVTKADGATFDTPVVLAITTAGTAHTKLPVGTNIPLLMALIGPRYS